MQALLTPEEVASRLKLSKRTVIQWLQLRKLPGLKVGSRWRVREQDLDTFIQSGQDAAMDEESRAWLEADLGGDLPPYDWGKEGPPKGEPVRYVPGVGLVIGGGRARE